MNKTYTAYRDGRILYVCNVDSWSAQALRDSGIGLLEGAADTSLDYVIAGRIERRPSLSASLQSGVIAGLPFNSTIYINDTPYHCEDSQVQLEFDQPGTYRIRVECWPYLDQEFIHEENPTS